MKQVIYQAAQLIRRHQHLLSTNKFTTDAALFEGFFYPDKNELTAEIREIRLKHMETIQFIFNGFLRMRHGITAILDAFLTDESVDRIPAIDFTYICLLVFFVMFEKETLRTRDEEVPEGFQFSNAYSVKCWLRGASGKTDDGGVGRLAADVCQDLLCAVIEALQEMPRLQASAEANKKSIEVELFDRLEAGDLTKGSRCLIGGLRSFYELSYIYSGIMEPLQEKLPLIQKMELEIEEFLHSVPETVKSTKPPTELDPFLLTKIEPRKVIVPEPIPSIIKANPVPKSHYSKLPKAEMLISRDRVSNRANLNKELKNVQQFAVVKKTEELVKKRIKEEKESKRPEKYRQKLPTIKRNPTERLELAMANHQTANVRNTNAEILRQEALVRKRREEERKRFENELSQGVAGTMTDREFEIFEQQAKDQEESDAKLHQRRLRLQVQLSREEAQLAKETALQKKSEQAADTRTEISRLQQEALQRSIVDTKEKLKVIEQIQFSREHYKELQQRMVDEKRGIAVEIDKELQELHKERQREDAEERQRKMDLIRQIRAMEQATLANLQLMKETKILDLTETSGVRLLTEMSIVELQERLRIMKIREAEELEQRRANIQALKERQQSFINEKQRLIEEYRNEMRVKDELKKELKSSNSDCVSQTASQISFSTRCSTVRTMQQGSDSTNEIEKLQRIQAKLDKVRMQRKRLEQQKSVLNRVKHVNDQQLERDDSKQQEVFINEVLGFADDFIH